jgi:hypothetical protein
MGVLGFGYTESTEIFRYLKPYGGMEKKMSGNDNFELDFSEEQKRQKKMMLRNIVCFAVIIVIATVFFNVGKSGSDISWSEDSVSITDKDGETVTLQYKDINRAQLLDTWDMGENVSGDETKSYTSGVRQNDDVGQFTTCINRNVDKFIVLYTDSDIWVLNYESEDVTEDIYDSMLETFSTKGYTVSTQ